MYNLPQQYQKEEKGLLHPLRRLLTISVYCLCLYLVWMGCGLLVVPFEKLGAPKQVISFAQAGAALPRPTFAQITGTVTSLVSAADTVGGAFNKTEGYSGYIVILLVLALFNLGFLKKTFFYIVEKSPGAFKFKYIWMWLAALALLITGVYANSIGFIPFVSKSVPLVVLGLIIAVAYYMFPHAYATIQKGVEILKDIAVAIACIIIAAPFLVGALLKANWTIPAFLYKSTLGNTIVDLGQSLSSMDSIIYVVVFIAIATVGAYIATHNNATVGAKPIVQTQQPKQQPTAAPAPGTPTATPVQITTNQPAAPASPTPPLPAPPAQKGKGGWFGGKRSTPATPVVQVHQNQKGKKR